MIRIHAFNMSFRGAFHSAALGALADLNGMAIRCHPVQAQSVHLAMENLPTLPVVPDNRAEVTQVMYLDVRTGQVFVHVTTLSIPITWDQVSTALSSRDLTPEKTGAQQQSSTTTA